jgi:hypothetical protein
MPTVGDEFYAAASLLRTEVDAEGQVQGLQQVSQNQFSLQLFYRRSRKSCVKRIQLADVSHRLEMIICSEL